jgi:signal transduction histidine kinase
VIIGFPWAWFDQMKAQNTEFYIGLSVWMLDLSVAYGLWFAGDKDADITHPVTITNIVLVAALYLMFLLGHMVSYGVILNNSTRLTKLIGLAISSLAILGLTIFFFFGMVALLATILVIQLVKYIDEKPAFVFAILVPCFGVLVDVLMGREFEYPVIIIYGTFNILAILTNFRLISERDARRESEQLVKELKATQILLSATTKRDERLRISRDLHDSIGHQLTALSLQLEVASHVKEEEKAKHLQQAKAISNTLLSDVRATVSEFRDRKDFDLKKALEALTRDLPGLQVELVINLDETSIDARKIEVIFRCVQESLTNIAKHSNASRCDIKLSIEGQSIILTVDDNGQNIAPIQAGNGLTGMKERVIKTGGELNYQILQTGFNLTAEFPINGGV